MEVRYKMQMTFGIILLLTIFTFAVYKPSITGHVLANVNRQNLDLVIDESRNFLLSSDSLEPFIITSFKVSGNIAGDGQVKVYIDTGKGQRVLVYENIQKKEDVESGLSSITGKATEEISEEIVGDKWLVVKPIDVFLEKEVFSELNEDEYLVSDIFTDRCIETCVMNMEISRDIAYRLVFLVEEGTILKINDVVYQTLE